MNKKNTNFLRRLIVAYSSLLLITLLMGGYLYNISIENVSKEIRTQTKLTLEKSITDMNSAFRTMDALAGQVVSTTNVVQLANMPDNGDNAFYRKAYYAKEDLSIYVFTESILPIQTSYIHMDNTDYLLSFSQFSEAELYYTSEGAYNRDLFNSWMTMIKDHGLNRQFIPLDQYKRLSDSSYLYKLPLSEYSLKNVPATLCFEISSNDLNKIFDEIKFFDTGYLYAIDGEGNHAFTLAGDKTIVSDPNLLTNLDYIDGLSSFRQESGEMFVTTASSDSNRWQYYLVQPASESLYSLTQYRNIFLFIILGGLVFILAMIIYLSKTNVEKITQLGSELQDTLLMKEDLQEIVDSQKPVIRQSYLRKILTGGIATQEELDYAQHYLTIDDQDRKFAVLYLSAYINHHEVYDDTTVVTVPEDLNYMQLIQEALARFFQVDYYLFSPKEGEYTLLLSTDAQTPHKTSSSEIKASFQELHDYLKTKYSIWTLAGIGNWHEGLMITWNSYQQASEAISYCTKRDTFKCYSHLDKDTTNFYYPIELTTQLTNFISNGNSSQVLEIFEIIRHENMEERSLPVAMVKYLLSDVRNTLYKVRFPLKNNDDNLEELEIIDALFNQHMSLKLCEDIALRLCQLFEASAGGNKLITTIRHYIDENFRDPSLCLTKISDEFSISESYFSFLFKEEIGENFSNYLGRTRLAQAYDLLKSSDINISEIYHEVGYNNSHSFRRAFKKLYAMSPKEARVKERSDA